MEEEIKNKIKSIEEALCDINSELEMIDNKLDKIKDIKELLSSVLSELIDINSNTAD